MPEGALMADLAQILKQNDFPPNSPVSPLEETEFGQSMRRRADRLPQIPARLSLSNLLRSTFTSAADFSRRTQTPEFDK
jgi:hypothetical protein